MRDDLRRVALFGSGVAELTRHRAEQLAKDLIERSKQNRDELMKLIRGEIANQLASLGVATKRDLERIDRRVTRLEGGRGRKSSARKKSSARSTAKASPAKRTVPHRGGES